MTIDFPIMYMPPIVDGNSPEVKQEAGELAAQIETRPSVQRSLNERKSKLESEDFTGKAEQESTKLRAAIVDEINEVGKLLEAISEFHQSKYLPDMGRLYTELCEKEPLELQRVEGILKEVFPGYDPAWINRHQDITNLREQIEEIREQRQQSHEMMRLNREALGGLRDRLDRYKQKALAI